MLCGIYRFLLFTVGLVVVPAALPVALAEVSGNSAQLTVKFDDISLEEALGEIANNTGIEVITSQALEKKIQLHFPAISAEKLLNRLLHGYNAMYLRNPQTGAIDQVRIFASGKAAPPMAKVNNRQTNPTETHKQNNKYYLSISLNGQPFNLLVDTGATILAVSEQVAQTLGLSLGDATPIQTANGKSQGYRTVIDSVSMAGKELKGVQAVVLPNLPEAGLIGQNVLAHFIRTTRNGKMRFEPLGKNNTKQAAQPSPDKTAPDKTAPDNTSPDKISPDKTAPNAAK